MKARSVSAQTHIAKRCDVVATAPGASAQTHIAQRCDVVANASLPIPAIWTTGSTAAIKTGTWRAALARHIHAPSPCHGACPVHGDIAEWIAQARARDYRAAWQTLTRHNPFPAIAGRICHHPCEAACNRAGYDESLSICKLERFVGDVALEHGWLHAEAAAQSGARVAVVGGGPSGLSATFQLRRRGHAVTLIESRPELGGLMRYGIPAYRLARTVLDGEIARIVAMGIEVRCGQALATPQAFAQLRADHDAVYLAMGARRQKRLPQLDYSRPWVVDGADYLARSSSGEPPALGRRLVVIGGGSAALDAARSARRAGPEVTILALEREHAMPAQREEVVEALEEGIRLVDSSMLRSAADADPATDGGLRLDCVRVIFEPGVQRGQFSVTPIEGSAFTLEADAVVSSIGQDPDLAPLDGVLATEGGLLRTDERGTTSATDVWAGGDMASMARFVTEAIGMGERAAVEIDRQLRARRGSGIAAEAAEPRFSEPLVPLRGINLHYHPAQPRPADRRLAPADRLVCDAEVQLGLDIERALAETERCFSCGTCTHCDNCVNYCPDMAVRRAGDGYVVLTDYCKGCGLCVKECPTGSMKMLEELR
jgi:NADPH-dependent glutamate synthase beta subunit-like oxidoreductase/Pyruvate/2-oxoacid:ferredoxin oxidoreductase delta subunit